VGIVRSRTKGNGAVISVCARTDDTNITTVEKRSDGRTRPLAYVRHEYTTFLSESNDDSDFSQLRVSYDGVIYARQQQKSAEHWIRPTLIFGSS
jgi:hypothetical protein